MTASSCTGLGPDLTQAVTSTIDIASRSQAGRAGGSEAATARQRLQPPLVSASVIQSLLQQGRKEA